MRLYQESYGNVPKDVWTLAKENFARELSGLRTSFRADEFAQMQEAAGGTNIARKVRRC